MSEGKTHAENGFTIIELMIAILFFAIVSTSICSLVLQSGSAAYRAEKLVKATAAATTQFEIYKGMSIDDPALAQTKTPGERTDGVFRFETAITDDIPLAKAPGSEGTIQTVSKLIQITVFSNKTQTGSSSKNQLYLARLHFIKTRSL